MTERVQYYIDLILTLCGYDGVVTDVSWIAIAVVVTALVVVMYAFYKAVIYTLWPGETKGSHIKRMVLGDRDGVSR